MVIMTIKQLLKHHESRILLALYKYYLSDITFERAAEEADVPIYLLVQYVNHNDLPIVHTEKDVRDGYNKVIELMVEKGIDVGKLKIKLST